MPSIPAPVANPRSTSGTRELLRLRRIGVVCGRFRSSTSEASSPRIGVFRLSMISCHPAQAESGAGATCSDAPSSRLLLRDFFKSSTEFLVKRRFPNPARFWNPHQITGGIDEVMYSIASCDTPPRAAALREFVDGHCAAGGMKAVKDRRMHVLAEILFLILQLVLEWHLWGGSSNRLGRSRSREQRRRDKQCEHCGYSLKGLPTSRCPECGQYYRFPFKGS